MEKKKLSSLNMSFYFGNCRINLVIDSSYSTQNKKTNLNNGQHFHTNYEMFFVGEQPLILHAAEKYTFFHSIVCIPPFEPHWAETDTGIYRFLFSFSQKSCKNSLDTFHFFENLFSYGNIFHGNISERVFEFASQIAEIYVENQFFMEEKLKNLFKLIFMEIYTSYNTKTLPSSNCDNYLLKIDDIIFNNYKEEISLSSLAKTLHLSTKQVSRIINKNYHKSLPTLLNDKKLDLAASMLAETDMMISKITEEVNFNNQSYFYNIFKKRYGCSPSAYRKKHKSSTHI